MNVLAVLLYNLSLLVGTVYLIVAYDWSPWWFLLTIALMANYIKKDKEKDKEE
jgi:hypothetical protein